MIVENEVARVKPLQKIKVKNNKMKLAERIMLNLIKADYDHKEVVSIAFEIMEEFVQRTGEMKL